MAETFEFLTVVDFAVKGLIFSKFGPLMGLQDQNKDIVMFPKEIAPRQLAERRGHFDLGFISLWRTVTQYSQARKRTPVARVGVALNYDNTTTKTAIRSAKAIPADIEYEVQFWTRDLNEMNKVVEEFLFWQFENPNLDMLIDGTYPVEFDLKFGDIQDGSSVPEMFEKGLIYVKTLPILVELWIPRFEDVKTVHSVTVSIYDESSGVAVLMFQHTYDLTQGGS